MPAAMIFAPSRGGISHAREEDTAEADLAVAIEAFGALATRRWLGSSKPPPARSPLQHRSATCATLTGA